MKTFTAGALRAVLLGAALAAVLAAPGAVGAQNASWLKTLDSGISPEVFVQDCLQDYGDWSTSHLAAEGQGPREPEASGDEDLDRDNQYTYETEYAEWASQYAALRISDGDPTTAWSEGAPGQGLGEVALVRADTTRPLRIWSGFGRNARLHEANSRPRRVTVWVLQAKNWDTFDQMWGCSGTRFGQFTVLARGEVELRDLNGWQALPLPAHTVPTVALPHRPTWRGELTFLAIRIDSVYPGSRWADTLISEIGPAP